MLGVMALNLGVMCIFITNKSMDSLPTIYININSIMDFYHVHFSSGWDYPVFSFGPEASCAFDLAEPSSGSEVNPSYILAISTDSGSGSDDSDTTVVPSKTQGEGPGSTEGQGSTKTQESTEAKKSTEGQGLKSTKSLSDALDAAAKELDDLETKAGNLEKDDLLGAVENERRSEVKSCIEDLNFRLLESGDIVDILKDLLGSNSDGSGSAGSSGSSGSAGSSGSSGSGG